MGVKISLDDFGTGYASLNFLRDCPVDRIKIDKEFIKALLHSKADEAIVRSLIDLSQQLGYSVIAEGIENREQLSLLREHGCEDGQGYLFGRPMSADLFADKFSLVDRLPFGRRA